MVFCNIFIVTNSALIFLDYVFYSYFWEHIQATNSPIYENAIAITQTPSMGCFPDYVGLHIVGTVVRIVSIRVLCRRRYVLSSIDNVVDEIEERVCI